MLYDILRSGNPESTSQLRKGPLIFTAPSATPVPKMPVNGSTHVHNPYPSPPVEHASLGASPQRRSQGASEVHSQGVGPTSHPAELPLLAHKSSRSSLVRVGVERTPSSVSRGDANSEHARPRVLTKTRPTTPQKPSTPLSHTLLPEPGDPLLLDDDPFARNKGVRMLKPRTRSSSISGTSSSSCRDGGFSSEDGHAKPPVTPPPPVPKAPLSRDDPAGVPPLSMSEKTPPSPISPDDYKIARQQRRGQWLEKAPPPAVADVVAKQLVTDEESEQVEEQPREPTPPPTYFPIIAFMSDANLLPLLLSYLSYSEWLALYSANKQIRELFQSRILREFVLERYLSTVGYSKWNYEWAEPLALSLKASSVSSVLLRLLT